MTERTARPRPHGVVARWVRPSLMCAALLACARGRDHGPQPQAIDAAPVAVEPPLSPMASVARDAAREARVRAREVRASLGATCKSTDAHLALRRAIGRGKTLWRVAATMGSETLLGPVRPVNEGGGSTGALDSALAAGDCAEARRALTRLEPALQLVEVETEHDAPPAAVARALADASLELGAIVVESSAEVGTSEVEVTADTEGLTDGIARTAHALAAGPECDAGSSARALAAVDDRLAVFRRAAASATERRGMSDRATLAREAGLLGVDLRALAASCGRHVRPPFAPRVASASSIDAEPVSVLTVPAPKVPPAPAEAALGRRLFTDRRLSRGGARACTTCHDPARAYTDGRAAPTSLDVASPLTRSAPTLLYASLQAAFLWDGRVTTAPTQALRVIHSTSELGLTSAELQANVAADPAYRDAFREAFPDGVTAANVARALGAFEDADLLPAAAPIDRFARGDGDALGPRARRGFDAFVAAGRCARCHVPPLFGGTRPADFAVTVYGVVGAPASSSGRTLDRDPGRAAITRDAKDEGSFKTPTLRNIARTAPYLHHGAYPTLEAVLDFYVRGGGRGLGLAVPNQDPEVRALDLTADERADLLDFLRVALTDATLTPPPRAPR